MYDTDITSIVENCSSRVRYQRLEPHGPRLGKLTPTLPLVDRFFTELPDNPKTKKHDRRSMALANNGWIWNANPLEDFASSKSRAYIRREVIAWGDCVKLRYGAGPEDSPWLWKHMTAYTELMAELFHGFRIDNCHSTPLHVGEKLLDAARRKNPNLYVCAELFTGSQEMDVYFVKRLGLNSLIREAMNGNDPKDMSRLLYIYGVGKPIGALSSSFWLKLIGLWRYRLHGQRLPDRVEHYYTKRQAAAMPHHAFDRIPTARLHDGLHTRQRVALD
jgi:glycogen debranching enzyme